MGRWEGNTVPCRVFRSRLGSPWGPRGRDGPREYDLVTGARSSGGRKRTFQHRPVSTRVSWTDRRTTDYTTLHTDKRGNDPRVAGWNRGLEGPATLVEIDKGTTSVSWADRGPGPIEEPPVGVRKDRNMDRHDPPLALYLPSPPRGTSSVGTRVPEGRTPSPPRDSRSKPPSSVSPRTLTATVSLTGRRGHGSHRRADGRPRPWSHGTSDMVRG